MVEAAGMWELGWSAPMTELVQWEMAMRSFGVERLNMTPISGLRKNCVSEYDNIETIIEDKAHLTPVFVDENGETELSDFDHPADALYIFGKATYSPFSAKAKQHKSVRIDCPKLGMLWPHQAFALVMYDRVNK